MSRPTPPTFKTGNWPAYDEALKRQGLLTIWFDPEMSGDAVLTDKIVRQQSYSHAAIQTCLSMKVPFIMALRQTTGFVEGLLRLVRVNGSVRGLSAFCRCRVAELWVRIVGLKGYAALGPAVTDAAGLVRPGKGDPRSAADPCNRAAAIRRYRRAWPPDAVYSLNVSALIRLYSPST